jgi:peroxiredoxin
MDFMLKAVDGFEFQLSQQRDKVVLLYVIDPEGRLRLLFPFSISIEEMADDILQLLRK